MLVPRVLEGRRVSDGGSTARGRVRPDDAIGEPLGELVHEDPDGERRRLSGEIRGVFSGKMVSSERGVDFGIWVEEGSEEGVESEEEDDEDQGLLEERRLASHEDQKGGLVAIWG